ncbi:MAG: hypothetical protein AB1649_03785 [Chloroflexota bacterium]
MRLLRFSGYFIAMWLCVLSVGCAPATTTLTTPTHEPVFSPTPTSSALPTAIPTADFTIEDISGTWTRIDPERGQLFLILDANGNYTASHGSPDDVVHAGTYSLEDRMFTFLDGWDCSPAEQSPGKYVIRLAGEGKYLLFEPDEDACPDRPESLKGFRWDRVIP